jgi:hypothetical protein
LADDDYAGTVTLLTITPTTGGAVDITWKVKTGAGELCAERVARLLARLILNGDHVPSTVACPEGCGDLRNNGRNEEIPSTQEVSS